MRQGTKVHDDIKKADDQDNGLFFTDNQVDQPVIALQQDGGILYRGQINLVSNLINIRNWTITFPL